MSVVVAFKEKSRVLAELWLLVATALFFSSTVSAPALAQTVSFNARLDFAVEARPIYVATGDFNGDRVQDLAVVNKDSASVSVMLGNGDGTFRAALTVAVGTNPCGPAEAPSTAPLVFAVSTSPLTGARGDFMRVGCQDVAAAK